jgi:hypothetical protein
LQFDVVLLGGSSYGQHNCSLPYSNYPFSVELPLDNLLTGQGFDLSHINSMAFVAEGDSNIGGVSYGISSIELSNDSLPGAIVCNN